MRPIEYLVIHHSLTADGTTLDTEAIRRYHVEVNGWNDIGYHYVIERVNGTPGIYEGRPVEQYGAHCKEARMNALSIGVCIVGNYDLAPPDDELLSFAAGACSILLREFKVPAWNAIGHREAGMLAGYDWKKGQYKSCPGKMFDMDRFRSMLYGPS